MPVSKAASPHPLGVLWPASALSVLKPVLGSAVLPVARGLVAVGVTANQVTLLSLAGSIVVGLILAQGAADREVFFLLPLWMVLRTVLAALDGTMAIKFGQKSRLGGVLNEVGDVVSDAVLVAPFAAISPINANLIWLLVALGFAIEAVGMVGQLSGAGRRLEGPFGKADRAIAFGALGAWVALGSPAPALADPICWSYAALSLITLSNRTLEILAERPRRPSRS